MSTGLIRPKDEKNVLVPSFMQEDEAAKSEGLETIQQFVVPPRIKIIQKNADEKYAAFEPGDIILTPQMIKIASVGEPFFFVPLLFYAEWCTVNPIQTKGQLPMIRDRSWDGNGEIARKSRIQSLREEVCPESPQYKMVNREYLSFIVLLFNATEPGLNGVPISLSFASGEHRVGTQTASLITMRKPAPIYGNVLQGVVPETLRKNQKGSWYGIDVSNPGVEGIPAYIQDKDEFLALQGLHRKVRKQYEERLIHVDYEDEPDSVSAPIADAEAKF
jgi:hypothetical protein